MKNIVLGISGSVAAYKAITLAKLLIANGFNIDIVLSKSAQDFISVITLKSLFPGRVYTHEADFDAEDQMLHIKLVKAADMILIAPASANMIAKFAGGFGDCLLTTLCLAAEAPIILAPAMNQAMWKNDLVQGNLQKLKNNGFALIGPEVGLQACGDFGYGRMTEPEKICEYIKNLSYPKLLKGKKIIITAGPTIEKIDPVRYLTNFSSGKMGYAIAQVAAAMGASVTLISGPTNLQVPDLVKFIQVSTADEMLDISLKVGSEADIFIATAAVVDYKPIHYHKNKIKKTDENLHIELQKNPDIIASIKIQYPELFCVGFAAETSYLIENGQKKLKEKYLDMIAINDVSEGKVFNSDHNELYIITKDAQEFFIERDTKYNIARKLLEIIKSLIPENNGI